MVIVRMGLRVLHRIADGSEAPDQAKVAPAQTAPVWLNQPSKGPFESVPHPYSSEVDGSAVGAASGKKADS
jgi:hypothetical protein